jgi:hypothetical protein
MFNDGSCGSSGGGSTFSRNDSLKTRNLAQSKVSQSTVLLMQQSIKNSNVVSKPGNKSVFGYK